jgi:predicted nucleic acid-binding protein
MTRSGLVVDASVAIKWIVDEPGSDQALALRDRDLAAPALLRVEAANVLRTLAARGVVEAGEARDLFRFLRTAPVLIVEHDDALEDRALDLALDLNHSVYDCLYLALAERMGRLLVTADRRFLGVVAPTDHAALVVDVAAAGA